MPNIDNSALAIDLFHFFETLRVGTFPFLELCVLIVPQGKGCGQERTPGFGRVFTFDGKNSNATNLIYIYSQIIITSEGIILKLVQIGRC